MLTSVHVHVAAGLSDVSDSEDENDDKLPIEMAMGLIGGGGGGGGGHSGIDKGRKASIALRGETGGLVVLRKGSEEDDDKSGDEVPDEDELLGQVGFS